MLNKKLMLNANFLLRKRIPIWKFNSDIIDIHKRKLTFIKYISIKKKLTYKIVDYCITFNLSTFPKCIEAFDLKTLVVLLLHNNSCLFFIIHIYI